MNYLENKNITMVNDIAEEMVDHIEKQLTNADPKSPSNSKEDNGLERRDLGLCCSKWKALACYATMPTVAGCIECIGECIDEGK